MEERIDASSSEPVHPLIERALTSKVPIAQLIGFGVEELGGGRAVASLRSGLQHANPMGTLHGGVLCDLSDAAMGMAFVTTVAPDESFTTVELSINFFRPVWSSQIEVLTNIRGDTDKNTILWIPEQSILIAGHVAVNNMHTVTPQKRTVRLEGNG